MADGTLACSVWHGNAFERLPGLQRYSQRAGMMTRDGRSSSEP
jgi:hypothetical protein